MATGIGPSKMQGLGPGSNLRKKNYDKLHTMVNAVLVTFKKNPTKPNEADVKAWLNFNFKPNHEDAKKYCNTKGTEAFANSYVNTLTALDILVKAYDKKDDKKLTEALKRELPRIQKELQSMAGHQYVAMPVPPARPATAAPTTPPQ